MNLSAMRYTIKGVFFCLGTDPHSVFKHEETKKQIVKTRTLKFLSL